MNTSNTSEIEENTSSETGFQLEFYSASKGQDIVRWLNQAEILLKFHYQVDKRKWTSVAFSHLRGPALDWLVDYLENKKSKKSEAIGWDEFREIITEEFYEKPNLLTWFSRQISVKPDYFYERFPERFVNEIRRAPMEISEDLSMCLFFCNLDINCKQELLIRKPSTLKEMINITKCIGYSRKEASKANFSQLQKKTLMNDNKTQNTKQMVTFNKPNAQKFQKFLPSPQAKERIYVSEIDDCTSIKEEIDVYPYSSASKNICLVDSGSSRNLINSNLTTNILKEKLQTPISVIMADGSEIKVEYFIPKLKYSIFNREFEDEFLIFPLKKYGIILGRQWLIKYNAIIFWRQNKIKFLSENDIKNDNLNDTDMNEAYIVSLHAVNGNDNFMNPELKKTVDKYPDIFPDKLTELPPERKQDHHIEIGSNCPVARSPYRLSQLELAELKKQLTELQENGFIQPSCSPWSAPVLFVKKKDGSLRLCIDYRGLNKITTKNKYPLAHPDDLLDQLGQAKYFTKIDLRSGYYQVRIAPNDVEKTAFTTRYGLYEFTVMPFGLTNAPATFITLMNDVLREFLDDFVVVYVDDILIYSKKISDHQIHVEKVLKKLREHKLFAKKSKCMFGLEEINFIGYKIGKGIIQPDFNTVEPILSLQPPKNVSGVRSFLGMINFYRRFIPNIATLSKPIVELLKKDVKFEWTDKHRNSFEALKNAVASKPCLRLPDFNRQFIITSDASGNALGGVLSQIFEDGEHPIAFESRKFTDVENRYEVYERRIACHSSLR